MISSVRGLFEEFDGSIYTTGKDFLSAEVDMWIAPSSLKTGDSKRDEHLRSSDFFDVSHYQQISFVMHTISKINNSDLYQVWGDLTIKDITKDIQLNVQFGGFVTDPEGKEKAGFTVSGKIKRSDFGLLWNSAWTKGGFVIDEEVSILCELELFNTGQDILLMRVEHNEADSRVF